MNALLERQRQAYLNAPMPSLEERKAKLETLKAALLSHKDALCDALSQDFGHRAKYDTLLSDVMPCVGNIDYTIKRLGNWMKPSRRSPGLLLSPASVTVHYQPLGVVGILVPWNFPVMLSIGPLITVLAAGNRAMIKLSEFTPATNQAIRALLAEAFDDDEVAIIEGEADAAAAFSALPFDHLLFTGSTAVGKHVMRAAADNLTPVTLELGGKSPTIIGPDMDIDTAVERMIWGKCLNAGQICTSPDYVLLPRHKMDAFVEAYRKRFARFYPKGLASDDYTSVVNPRQYQRLTDTLEDAVAKGAVALPATETYRDDERHRLATVLLAGVNDEMRVMQEEIFGPLLPLVPYDSIDEAIAYIQARPRPLALYLMSFDEALQERVLVETHAGGVSINDTVLHVAAEDAPFGGIGPSGMGHYHGHEGFLTFSKAKTVLKRGKFNSAKFVHPPYGNAIHKLMLKFFLRN
ncbi:coniferyl aldehyde dehydrogenase [Ferrimonas balearica]|uniref:coniferyl aldehyde dehydrogenase n=1 Tax=Ferrimonas balearica TaxID=44012 RepID=UPI001C99C6C4|nr:coniferyl aldehyde dehydrogenase [Ferrimonas balearica]MBY5922905.1 coniferyl aldehyde dehydrogenase [Ferrimonas balearica]MBY5997718.1 coniferyl aldehyde dehydrogenase [Ferrimonas balearica]